VCVCVCECPWLQRAQDHITSLINEYASCVHVTGLGQLPTITAICETLATATERAGAKIGSSRPSRIDIASRVGRPESTTRFESAGANDPNRQSDSSRATRIGKAIRAGRHESTKRFGRPARIDKAIRVGRLAPQRDSSWLARIHERFVAADPNRRGPPSICHPPIQCDPHCQRHPRS
jgi:hypothetical protein